MIIIEIKIENDLIMPIRELTADEKKTVTSVLSNGSEYIYYQGDEPKE